MPNPNLDQIRVLSTAEVHALGVESLGLDPEALDLESPEALAALVRRAASFSAPCDQRELRGSLLQALRGLTESKPGESENLRLSIDETIVALTSYGDLLELPSDDPSERASVRLLYLAPPTFVVLERTLFLLGGAFDGTDALPSDLRELVEYRSHTRRIRPADPAEVSKRLRAIGWAHLPSDLWLSGPTRVTARELVDRANAALAVQSTAGDVAGLTVLDPTTSPTFYPGRWVDPGRKSGRFVARREQRYGADLWSYVELANGVVTHLIDLPMASRDRIPPCDAAWHLQMAIDTLSGRPQRYRLRPSPPSGAVLVDFFSPVPLWARRRWDVLGEEIPRTKSLFAYRFPADEFSDVARALQSELWLSEREPA